MVNHVIPKTYQEALTYLNEGSYKVIAGGTDLMIQKRGTRETPPKFENDMLYCFNLEELKYVHQKDREIRIGSMTSLETLLHHKDTPEVLKKVISEMASPAIRNTATLSGNIVNASPAGDSLVPLYLLDAKIVLENQAGQRIVSIDQMITGPRQTVIKKDEMIKEIILPQLTFTHFSWFKVGGRRADAISKVSFLGACQISEDKIIDFRIALGAVYKTVVRSKEIESRVKKMSVSELKDNVNTMISLYEPLIQPIDDQRSNREYRLRVAKNTISNFILNI